MKLLDLFAGIGGFSLAAHWMGWETAAFCEQNKFCQQVLRKNFGQGITIHDDIRELDGTQYRGTADIVCGGFPCQPYSLAGKRKGTDDDRHLWPEMLRVITEVQPSFVVGENVFGLVNWSGGLVFEQVQADLEAAGYEVWAGVVPACAKDAPHRRDRLWIVAHTNRNGQQWSDGSNEINAGERGQYAFDDALAVRNDADANGYRLEANPNDELLRQPRDPVVRYIFGAGLPMWNGTAPASTSFCGVDDGIPHRVDRIKALGNSIVPQIAYEIFRAIEAAENK